MLLKDLPWVKRESKPEVHWFDKAEVLLPDGRWLYIERRVMGTPREAIGLYNIVPIVGRRRTQIRWDRDGYAELDALTAQAIVFDLFKEPHDQEIPRNEPKGRDRC